MSKKRKQRDMVEITAAMNSRTYDYWLRRLTELAVTSIEWKGLPPTVDVRFLELTLFNKGMSVFFRDDVVGFAALETMIGGYFNIYEIPTWRQAYAVNGYRCDLDENNSVIIFNNFLHTPSAGDIEYYAYKLYEIDRAIDVNVKNQKTPKIVVCSENQRLVLKNLFMQYDGNFPFIFGDNNLDFKTLDTLDTSSPFVADKLQGVKRQILNEALTYLGIESNSNEKAERLVQTEALSNIGSVEAQRDTRLAARQQAADQINKMFGLHVAVEFKNPLSVDRAQDETEVTGNGAVHNGSKNDM